MVLPEEDADGDFQCCSISKTWNLASIQVTEMRSSISQIGFDFKQLNEMISGIVSLIIAL